MATLFKKGLLHVILPGVSMRSRVQQLAEKLNMTVNDFIGEMRKRGCSEPTALKIWNGLYEEYKDFNDNDIFLSNLRKAADVLKVSTGQLLPTQDYEHTNAAEESIKH